MLDGRLPNYVCKVERGREGDGELLRCIMRMRFLGGVRRESTKVGGEAGVPNAKKPKTVSPRRCVASSHSWDEVSLIGA